MKFAKFDDFGIFDLKIWIEFGTILVLSYQSKKKTREGKRPDRVNVNHSAFLPDRKPRKKEEQENRQRSNKK